MQFFVAGTVTGSVGLVQLKQLRSEFQTLQSRTNLAIHSIENVILVAQRNSLYVDIIYDRVNRLNTDMLMNREIIEIQRSLDRLEKLMIHLQNNRIYPGLFRGDQASELLKDLQSQARTQGYDLLLNQEDVFYQSEALFIRNQNLQEITVVLLVPIARSRNAVNLYRYRFVVIAVYILL